MFTVPLCNLTVPPVFKAGLDQVMVFGRTLDAGADPPSAGRPASVITARGGGYGPGSPSHGLDHLVPSLQDILANPLLSPDLQVIVPELTHAPVVPAMAELVPLHEAAMAQAHQQAFRQGELLTKRLAA